MTWEESIRDEIFSILESWNGFDIVRDTMQRYSKLDIYVAGGVVRDVLLSESGHTKDIDLFLNGPDVDQALNHLDCFGTLHTGPFGSPRWIPDGKVQYADVIPIPRFLNGLWACEDILDVLNQFDFTCNAIALDLRSGAFFNPQNGIRDARRRLMRAVRFDYPDEPITPGNELSRPAVLWFRLLHYAASKRLAIEPVTLSWLRDHRHYGSYQKPFVASFFPLQSDALALLEQGPS
jgi:tRNA nucleotidyltransferase (CCA-adding enzyme)